MANTPALRTRFIHMTKHELQNIATVMMATTGTSYDYDIIQHGSSVIVIAPIQASMFLIGAVADQGLDTLYSSEVI